MVKVKVQVQILCIDVIPGEPVYYRNGAIFECPEERAKKLGNSVIILPETELSEPLKPPVIQPTKKKRR